MKIGLYFGSFNPIHTGHMIIANFMAYHTDLDKVWLGRRKKCVNLWVVRSADILAFDAEDEDMFANNHEKTYRDASGFKVMEKINKYKKATHDKE